jgi:hypothetical protein
MGAMLETIQNAIILEQEAEAQPCTPRPDGTAIETRLTQEISDLWGTHLHLSTDRKSTAKELRRIRARLAERLFAMKKILSRPDAGRGGQWRSWLRQRGIPRSTADRLVGRYAETLCPHGENVPTGAVSEPEDSPEKLATSVWQRFRKTLATDERVFQFIGRIVELSGVGHEQRAEGLVIFKPVTKAAEEVRGPASVIDSPSQPSDEAPAVTEEAGGETATTPNETEATAVANAGSGAVP